MTLPSKQRRKKPPEALDWRELARGPALRGLAEVLATPPEIAKERAEQRTAADQVTEQLYDPPTVGVTLSDQHRFGEPKRNSTSLPPKVVRTALGGDTPTVGIRPAVVLALSEVETPTDTRDQLPRTFERSERSTGLQDILEILPDLLPEGPLPNYSETQVDIAITEGDTPSVVLDRSGVVPPTVGVTVESGKLQRQGDQPTVGATPSIRSVPSYAPSLPPPAQSEPQQRNNPPASIEPAVGVTPSVPLLGTRWVDADGTHYEAHRVQRIAIAQQSMALGEERVYQALWHAKESDGVFFQDRRTKIFSLGYDRLARLVRLNEKSVRMLLPKLISKKILEVVASENSATRTGRKYRVFSYEEILDRQRAANLLHIVKNGRAVEFVQAQSANDHPPTVQLSPEVVQPSVGVAPTEAVGGTPPETVGEPSEETVGVTTTPLDKCLVKEESQTPSSSSIHRALAEYGSPDDDAVRHLIGQCKRNAPDADPSEIVHFIHDKGQVIRKGKIFNPIAFLLVYVPKCFLGNGLQEFRQQRRKAIEAEQARQRELDEWHKDEIQKQQAILDDPKSSEEDKRWARQFLT